MNSLATSNDSDGLSYPGTDLCAPSLSGGPVAQRYKETPEFPPNRGEWVYFIKERGPSRRIKIGFASNVRKRLAALQTGAPEELYVAAWTAGSRRMERGLHAALGRYRLRGEWFHGADEVFDLAISLHGRLELDWGAAVAAVNEHIPHRGAAAALAGLQAECETLPARYMEGG